MDVVMILILLVIGVLAFLFGVLLEAVLIWAASKILKLKKQEFKIAFKTALIHSVLLILLIILCLIPLFIAPALGNTALALMMPLITVGMILVVCIVSIVLLVYLIRKYYEEDWRNAILAFILVFVLEIVLSILLALPLMIFGTVLWQLGIFSSPSTSVVTTDFFKLQPLSPSISYKENGDFNAAFVNIVGTSIQLTSVSLTEDISLKSCDSITVNGQPLTSASYKVTVASGDAFTVSAKCPVKGKGDYYDVSVKIEYNAMVGGLTTSHEEKGNIRGPVE